MEDNFNPTADIDFICHLIEMSGKVIGRAESDDVTTYFLDGTKPLFARAIHVKKSPDGVVDFNLATAIAVRLGMMGQLLSWFEENRNWKDGGYFVPKS